jgi:hypothetical protein
VNAAALLSGPSDTAPETFARAAPALTAQRNGSGTPPLPGFSNLIEFLLVPREAPAFGPPRQTASQQIEPEPFTAPEQATWHQGAWRPHAWGQPPGSQPAGRPASGDGSVIGQRSQGGRAIAPTPLEIADALLRTMLGAPVRPLETGSDPAPGASQPRDKKVTLTILQKRTPPNSSNDNAVAFSSTLKIPAGIPLLAFPATMIATLPAQANPPIPGFIGVSTPAAAMSGDPGVDPGASRVRLAPSAFEARLTPNLAPAAPPAAVTSSAVLAEGAVHAAEPARGDARDPRPDVASRKSSNAGPASDFPDHAIAAGMIVSSAVATPKMSDSPAGPPQTVLTPADGVVVTPLASRALPERAGHIQEVTVRISAANTPVVDVQVQQRQGQVFVAVRTGDEGLQTSLRQDLPRLVTALDRAGFRAETYVPAMAPPPATGGDANPDASRDSSRGAAQDFRQDFRQDLPQDSQRDSRGAGLDSAPSPDPSGQQQQRQRDQRHQSWLDQMED